MKKITAKCCYCGGNVVLSEPPTQGEEIECVFCYEENLREQKQVAKERNRDKKSLRKMKNNY